jgi:hypothetical protein
MGDLTLADFRNELKFRGFDGFLDADLNKYVRWGEYHVARTARYLWQEKQTDVILDPGEYRVTDTDIPNLKSVKKVLVIDPYENENPLGVIEDDNFFFDEYGAHDLTLPVHRGEPSRYFVTADSVLILPPPEVQRTVRVHYWAGAAGMREETDKTGMPPDMDEAVLVAAEIRCHTRARQLEFANESRMALNEILTMELNEVGLRTDEAQDRVETDPAWRY